MGARLARSAAAVFLLAVASRVLGFVREMVLAAVFGAGRVTDAYTITFAIPSVLFQAVGSAITTIVIPMLTRYRATGRDEDFREVAWTLFHGLLLALVAILAAAMILVDPLVRLFAPGFAGEQLELTRRLALIMLPGIVFMGINGWMQGVLNSCGNVVTPAAVGIPQNLVLIGGTYFLGRAYGIEAVAWASLVALAAQVILQWSALRRVGLPYRPVFRWNHPDLRAALRRTGPVVAATGTGQISQTVERALASGLPEGSAASLSFAQRITGLPQGLLMYPVSTVLYPELTRRISQGDRAGFLALLRRGLRLHLFLMFPITAGMLALRSELVRLVFERGRFDAHDTQMTAFALAFLCLGLTGFAWRDLMSRAMYSTGDTWTPASTGIVALTMHILLSLLLVRYLAHGGIALSWSISLWWSALVLLVRLRRRLGPVGGRSLLGGAVQAAVASAVMVVVVEVLRRGPVAQLVVPDARTVAQATGLLLLVVAGAAVYGAVLALFRVEELAFLGGLARKALARLGGAGRSGRGPAERNAGQA
ncbi:murein biosynthesis integral membrane protein MurJ [Thermaerobacter sp. PB12/4term]|nr:murein biosynthesis integral membrane protein MurJ [Thermaerobacter sp. PB12/4term]